MRYGVVTYIAQRELGCRFSCEFLKSDRLLEQSVTPHADSLNIACVSPLQFLATLKFEEKGLFKLLVNQVILWDMGQITQLITNEVEGILCLDGLLYSHEVKKKSINCSKLNGFYFCFCSN